jgi:2-methylisocitrate lyase-like PEP mutase family enzyme
MLPAGELQAMGVKLLILPLSLTLSSIHAMRQTLQVMRTNGADTRAHAEKSMATWADCNRLTGIDNVQRIETRFSPVPAER